MPDKRNTKEITPESGRGDRIDDRQQVMMEGLPEEDITQEDPAESEYEPDTNVGAKDKQKDAATGVTRTQDGQGGREDEKDEEDADNDNTVGLHRLDDKDYSVFTRNEKRIIVLCAGICSCFSPISSQIYFPSLDVISTDLRVSNTLVNLTITSYLVSDLVRLRSKSTY